MFLFRDSDLFSALLRDYCPFLRLYLRDCDPFLIKGVVGIPTVGPFIHGTLDVPGGFKICVFVSRDPVWDQFSYEIP